MKKVIIPIMIGTAMTLAGCAAKPDLSALDQPLTTAINQHQYAKAAGLNAAIVKLDNSDTAKQRAKQLAALTKAQEALDANDFKAAERQAGLATKGNTKLTVAAKELKAQALKYQTTKADITNQLEVITTRSETDIDDANNQLQALLAKKVIHQDRFHAQYIQALRLQITLGAQGKSSATKTPEANSPTSNAEDPATSTTPSSSTPAPKSSDGASVPQPEGHPVADADTISNADLESARTDIKAAGENPDYFSGNDLSQAILKARAAGRTHLQASDWQ